jgi:hypothetical protein
VETLSQAPDAEPFLAFIDPETVRLCHYRSVDIRP